MYFLTGASGFLGCQLLGRLVLKKPDHEFSILIRPNQQGSAEKRKEILLEKTFGSKVDLKKISRRVKAIEGDLSLPNFGLSSTEYRRLAERTSQVLHCAATTNLGQELSEGLRDNVGGTTHVLDFCKSANTISNNFALHYVSTAYVAGDVERVVKPEELDLNAPFRNSYERTKAQSENLVRQHKDEFKCVIYRPSIVVGDSITGETSAFNVIYPPIKFFLRGLFTGLPAKPHIPFDIVPVDYVADSIVSLMQLELATGSCYYLTSGVGRETNPLEILELAVLTAQKFGEKHFHIPAFISPELLGKAFSRVYQAREILKLLEAKVTKRLGLVSQLLPFIPYMLRNPQFDSSSTHLALPNQSGVSPLFKNYGEQIISYCLETNWGKIPWSNPRNRQEWPSRILAN